MNHNWITIGQVRKPHGVRGYVSIAALSDIPDRFVDIGPIWLEFPDGRRERLKVEDHQGDGRNVLLKLASIDDLEAADRLRGAYIQVRMEETAGLPDGQFYAFQLVGSLVITENGDEIGRIREVMSMPANDVFVVNGPQGETLIPAIHDIVTEIDPERKRVVIRLMPGLIG